MFKKLTIPIVGTFFLLILVSCTTKIPDISETIDKVNKIEEGLDQIDIEIEELETEIENKK